MHLETELKFIGHEDTISALRQSRHLQELAGARGARTVSQRAVYFDSERHDLWKAGYVLRVRNEGEGYAQTLKRVSHADLASRSEFKSDVATAAPDLSTIPDSKVRWRVTQLLKERELVPQFVIETRRTKLILSPSKRVEIEAAFDTGTIMLPDESREQSIPISEFELELLKGSVEDLFSVARDLTAAHPLTLSLSAKSERGFAMLAREPYAPIHAQKVVLHGDAPADDALCAIFGNCLQHLLGNWNAVVLANDAEGIHQMRVALRRFRSAVSLLDERQQEELKSLIDDAKSFASVLGQARDYDVLLSEIVDPVAGRLGLEAGGSHLSEPILARRRDGWTRVIEALNSEKFRAFVLEWAAITYRRPWLAVSAADDRVTAQTRSFAKDNIQRRVSQVCRAAAREDDPSIKQLHELRIKMKKLRYALDFFGSQFSKSTVKRCLKRLSKLQAMLGEVNDVSVARTLMHQILIDAKADPRAAELAYEAGLVLGWHSRRVAEHRKSLRKILRKLGDPASLWKAKPRRSAEDADAPTD
jgi:inorganic triphosphatase YgiF